MTRDPARAQGDFAVARALAGGLEPALLLAKAFYLDGNPALTEETLDDLHANAGAERRDEISLWAAAVYQSLNDPDRGLAWVERLVVCPIKERLEAFFLCRLKRHRDAIVAGNATIARNPRDPVAHLVLGLTLIEDLIARGREGPTEAEIARLLAVTRAAAEMGGKSDLAARVLRAAASLALGVGGAVVGQDGFFDEGQPVCGVNSSQKDSEASVTADGLLISFVRMDDRWNSEIWSATRSRPDECFGTPALLPELNSPYGEGAHV